MTHYRKALRDAFRNGLKADARFASFEARRALAKPVDPGQLPVLTTTTAGERSARDAVGLVERRVLLAAGLRREGSEVIEDELDLDAAAAEVVAFEVLPPLCDDLTLTETLIEIDHTGDKRIGTVVLKFEALVLTSEGVPERPAP